VVSLEAVELERGICVSCGKEFPRRQPSQERCKKACRWREGPTPVTFCAVDGEGSGRDPSKYVLLGCGQEQIDNPDGLSWKECFEFLYRQFESKPKGTAFVGFFLGYDFVQMLKSMPEERVRMLITSEGIAKRKHRVPGRDPHPVDYDGWQFDILGSKRLKIRPKQCSCLFATCKCAKASWMYICDTGGLWQTSFLNVIHPGNWDEPVCTQEEYDVIATGKDNRDAAELGPEMRRYNRLENALLERATERVRDGFEAIGVHLSPRQWFGPGQAAQEWMKSRLPKREEWDDGIPQFYREAAQASYYGGWFEIFCHGWIERDVWEYDINSAYPATIRQLPCLLHGRYTRGEGQGDFPKSDYCIVRCRAWGAGVGKTVFEGDGGKPVHIGSLLHRNSKGSISRPRITEGWYWWTEVAASKSAGLIEDFEIFEWVNYEACECAPPLEGMEELYSRRLEVGKDTVLGKACKLVYNSSYGKFAQSVGNPRYGNPVYASRITSECRRTIVDAIGSHPDGLSAVAMVATDAVFFLAEHGGLSCDDRLGSFSRVRRHNLTVFKPGVYWDEKTREDIRRGVAPKFKARGVSARDFAGQLAGIDSQFRAWGKGEDRRQLEWPSARFKSSFSMVTCLQAIRRGDWTQAGRKVEVEPCQDSDPHQKRAGLWWDGEWEVWRSEPLATVWDDERGDWDCVSRGYEKKFGFEDPFGEESKEAMGVNDDGNVLDLIRWVLKE
jgi:hypothetical protein